MVPCLFRDIIFNFHVLFIFAQFPLVHDRNVFQDFPLGLRTLRQVGDCFGIVSLCIIYAWEENATEVKRRWGMGGGGLGREYSIISRLKSHFIM